MTYNKSVVRELISEIKKALHSVNYWFARDVTAAMLVYRTMAKKQVFWEFDSIIMQNLNDILLLFCTPTCPPNHVSATKELIIAVKFLSKSVQSIALNDFR